MSSNLIISRMGGVAQLAEQKRKTNTCLDFMGHWRIIGSASPLQGEGGEIEAHMVHHKRRSQQIY